MEGLFTWAVQIGEGKAFWTKMALPPIAAKRLARNTLLPNRSLNLTLPRAEFLVETGIRNVQCYS